MPEAISELPAVLRVLSDPTRLRILGLLELCELSVGELGRALGMAQSRVSNHLRVLRETGFLSERHEGTSTFLRPGFDSRTGSEGPLPARLWATLRENLASLPEHEGDRMRLQGVLDARHKGSRDFFDSVAGEWDKLGASFESGQGRQRAVANLLGPELVLADLGCGTGYMARALTGLATRLICVDRSQGMLDQARKRLQSTTTETELEFRAGELDALPIADDEVDGAIAGMVLHHVPELDAPLAEMFRIVRPGGSAVVMELAPHKESWMHAALGDRHLGLSSSAVAAAIRRAGFIDVRMEAVDDRYCPTPPGDDGEERVPTALPLYIVRGRVPSGRH